MNSNKLFLSALALFTVTLPTGEVDREKSAEKFLDALDNKDRYQGTNEDVIRKAAIACLEDHTKKSKTNLSGLPQSVLVRLQLEGLVTQENAPSMAAEIADYIKANTGEYPEKKLFGSRKGPGGGHWLWAGSLGKDKDVIAQSKSRFVKASEKRAEKRAEEEKKAQAAMKAASVEDEEVPVSVVDVDTDTDSDDDSAAD
jgi:hypothetical protein